MKLTDDQFHQLFDRITEPPIVVGLSKKDSQIWIQGHSFAISRLYDVLVTNGEDEDDKYFERLNKQLRDKDE